MPEGAPKRNIRRKSGRSKRNCPTVSNSLRFFGLKYKNANNRGQIHELITLPQAAPIIPISGKPKRPNTNR